MKKINFLITSLVVIGLTTIFYACEEESSIDSPVDNTICTTTSSGCGGSFETCANSTSVWYTYNGKKYTCSSTSNCNSAATALVNDMCSKSAVSKTDFDKKVQDVLNTFPTNNK
ncbi:hypothetical protein [Flavobacterium gawalongense]|uniref:Lipoprotein n=1 Tax=Flavobacterium gawalongense TaxID=2594432 RepID=A0A553BXA3_9FLAO|nr:hypothetical protein [Flavobacterium gawalongense]TRX04169.1 hypothetical protein FNW33_01430 [Flavobacterium gawalongense]TRX09381.1 hypothetical protein FNW12_02840 [Flavobacterium gawalongense]TRX12805.1 hypothetical protein FNW11_01940 [Flavobacterium gawalongense]TRX13150.1 hypothetical protein FNW10_01935 [Flavobacterium gawalongense]TRX30788.1 hypothetical protein FNW38_03315 [Flavobacterium gawalongense]